VSDRPLVAILALVLAAIAASTANAQPKTLDCAELPCAEVLPGAVSFEAVPDARYFEGRDAAGDVVGWLALSTDFVDIKAYSGKPMVTLVGLDTEGTITGARVVHHSEPILLLGIPDSALAEFVSFYAGRKATDSIVVGRSSREGAISVDAISGATVTVLAQNHTILEVARILGVEVGVIAASSVSPGRFVEGEAPWTFPEMVERGALGHLLVTEREMGVSDADAPFVDLYFGIADAPHIGEALIGAGDYAYYRSQIGEGEHLVVVLGNGSDSFKGSGFVRGGIFDRVRLEQDLREITFHDSDYWNLPGTSAVGAPDFREGAVFVARDGRLDPGAPYELIFLGSRYDRRGAFTREFHEFRAGHRLPDSVYELDAPGADAPWRQAWRLRALDAVLLSVFLLFVVAIFVFRGVSTADPRRLKHLHLGVMIVSFLGVGVWMGAQPSVTQVLTAIGSALGEWRWELFLSEPLIFISWIFIMGVSLVWGRGVFCGWVCPYGAMTELLQKVAEKVGIQPRELPDAVHQKLRYLRYGVLLALIAAFLYDSLLGERLAEVEPFKSTFLVPAWQRSGLFLGWWLLLLGASVVMYRPFCRYLCPLGAGLSVMSSFRPLGPRRRRFCSSCQICTRGCESNAFRSDGSIDPRECLSCLDCEATYRNPKVCPPLLAITRLEVQPDLRPSQRKKLDALQHQAEDL
jgi:NosR/NirI family nitrous oxide reductase transcriptional regulator